MGIEWSISHTLIPGNSKIDFPWNPFHAKSWNRPSSDVTLQEIFQSETPIGEILLQVIEVQMVALT